MSMSETDPAKAKTDTPHTLQSSAPARAARRTQSRTPATGYKSRAIDPQSWPMRWAATGNSRLGRLYMRLRAELVGHAGGAPNAAQRALIDRIAMVQVRMAIMDEKMFRDGDLSEHAGREYLAWANSMSRMLQALGLDGAPAPQPTLADYLASKSPKP